MFYRNTSSGSRVVPCGRTDGQPDMTNLIVAFCNFTYAPKTTVTLMINDSFVSTSNICRNNPAPSACAVLTWIKNFTASNFRPLEGSAAEERDMRAAGSVVTLRTALEPRPQTLRRHCSFIKHLRGGGDDEVLSPLHRSVREGVRGTRVLIVAQIFILNF
jgi:hypothetical protein